MKGRQRISLTPSRIALVGLLFLLLGAECEDTAGPPLEPEREWELWPRRDVLPPESETEALSWFGTNLGNVEFCDEYRGQVIPLNVRNEGVDWKGVQGFCDARVADTVVVNRWLLGFVGFFWRHDTINPEAMFRTFRFVAIEIDGERIPVTVDDILAFTSDDGGTDVAAYVIFPRFKTPGVHSLKYIYHQEAYFFFHFDHDLQIFEGYPDVYPEYEGRRVFVPEVLGDPVDGYMTVSWTLNVVGE